MKEESFLIYGAGGHAKVIIDLVITLGGRIDCIFDDQPEAYKTTLMGIPVRKYNSFQYPNSKLIIAIGNNKVRKSVSHSITHRYATLIHPTAFVSKYANVSEGTVILANAIVQAEAKIGQHVIINAGACIDHEAVIEDFAHIASLVYIGGAASIGTLAYIRPGVIIERMATIAPNALVEQE